jgi:hypothetical protein
MFQEYGRDPSFFRPFQETAGRRRQPTMLLPDPRHCDLLALAKEGGKKNSD